MIKEKIESDKTGNVYDSKETMKLVEGFEEQEALEELKEFEEKKEKYVKDFSTDLGIVFGTKEEAMWIKVRDSTQKRIEAYEEALIVERAMFDLAKFKVNEEKLKGGNENGTNRKTD